MAKELPKRSEVKLENTWKLEDMYATQEDWEADVAKARKLVEELFYAPVACDILAGDRSYG